MVAIPNKRNDISEFIFQGISILNYLRHESSVLTDQAVKALAIQLGIVDQDHYPSYLNNKINVFINSVLSFFRYSKLLFEFFKNLKYYQKQYCLLKKVEKQQLNCSIIAIASNRLFGEKIYSSMRRYLSILCRDFLTGNLSNELNDFFSEQKIIFLHDPCHHSKFWEHRYCLWKENIFILDTNFSFFISMLYFRDKKKSLFKNLYSLLKKIKIKRTITTFFIESLSLLLAPYSRIDSFFLTSNSFLTEIIRFYLIKNERCFSVCEVMHGVPTIFYEQYIKDLLEYGKDFGSYEKHSSIAQLPNLPMFGVLKQDVKCKPEYSINCYLNQYVYNKIGQYGCFEKYLEYEINVLLKDANTKPDCFVISFIGSFFPDNAATRPNFFESNYFKVELKIMQYINNLLKKQHKNYLLIYTPHPSHHIDYFLKHPIFKKNNIVIYTNTILTWLIADISMSILSSATFESSYFGVSGFMLSDLKDGLYPRELLNTLDFFNETDTETLELTIYQKLDKFIESNAQSEHSNLLTKAKRRIKNFEYQIND